MSDKSPDDPDKTVFWPEEGSEDDTEIETEDEEEED